MSVGTIRKPTMTFFGILKTPTPAMTVFMTIPLLNWYLCNAYKLYTYLAQGPISCQELVDSEALAHLNQSS